MRRTAVLLALGAALLTACGGTDETAAPAPSTTAPSTTGPAAPPPPAATTPAAPPAAPSVPAAPQGSAPSLSPDKQAESLDRIYDRLPASARKQFCEQSDSVGAGALAEQLSQRGGGALDENIVKDFLVDKCGKS